VNNDWARIWKEENMPLRHFNKETEEKHKEYQNNLSPGWNLNPPPLEHETAILIPFTPCRWGYNP
jgi:hypothetical protein